LCVSRAVSRSRSLSRSLSCMPSAWRGRVRLFVRAKGRRGERGVAGGGGWAEGRRRMHACHMGWTEGREGAPDSTLE
jgi:hypothetical protein